MTKRFFIISCILSAMLFSASMAKAERPMEAVPAIEQADENVGVSIQQSVLHVTGAAGETLEVVSLTGRHVMSVKIESTAQRIELNVPKGCYILKIGKVVRKVSIR